MERYDSEKAARVWQRVRGEGEMPLSGLPGMAAAEQTMAESLRQLQRQNPQMAAEDLVRESIANAAVLRGMAKLLGQTAEVTASVPQPKEMPENCLRRCYAAALQMLNAYERYADHPEYGPVFRELARRKRQHCFRIPELLGRQSGQKARR